MIKVFTITTRSGIEVNGEIDGNNNSKNIIIFSHSFGVDRTSKGMFTDIGKTLENNYLLIKFDYVILKRNGNQFVYQYTKQKEMLESILDYVRNLYPDAELNIIAHSMGGIIVGLAHPININKIILIASSIKLSYDRFIKYFGSRTDTKINENGTSKIKRSWGGFTIIPKEYLYEAKTINPIDYYLKLSNITKLYYIKAIDDKTVTDDTSIIKNNSKFHYKEIDGDHDFTGTAREILLETIKNIFST